MAAAMEIIPYLFWIGTTGWVVSANYDMAEEILNKIIGTLTERAGMERVGRPDSLQAWQFHYSSKNHVLVMGNGSTLSLKSAESPDSMNAVPVDYIMVDEAALVPFILYDTRLVPRLVDSGGWIWATGTFEWMQGEWFEEWFELGQIPNELGIKSWHHPTEDNFHTYWAKGGETPQEVAAIYHANWQKMVKTNPTIEWPLAPGVQVIVWNVDIDWLHQEKKRIRKEIYAARYEARSATNPYSVFPTWSVKEFVTDKAEFDPEYPVYLAIDPGGTYAVVAVQFIPSDVQNELTGNLMMNVIDEVYIQTTVTTSDIFAAARERPWWPNVNRSRRGWWDGFQGAIDVAAQELCLVWENLGRDDPQVDGLVLHRMKVNVQPGIQTLQHFLDTGSIRVHPRCTFFCTEMRRYHYPPPTIALLETSDPRKTENPKDEWNHAVKALIYLIVNRFGYYQKTGKTTVRKSEIIATMRETQERIHQAVVSRFAMRRRR